MIATQRLHSLPVRLSVRLFPTDIVRQNRYSNELWEREPSFVVTITRGTNCALLGSTRLCSTIIWRLTPYLSVIANSNIKFGHNFANDNSVLDWNQ